MAAPMVRDTHGNPLDLQAIAWQYRDNKIAGIKYLREKTGWGLKEAKEAFEHAAEGYVSSPVSTPLPPTQLDKEELQRIAWQYQDNKIAGIRYLREKTGWGLKETKDALDAQWGQAPLPGKVCSVPNVELPNSKRKITWFLVGLGAAVVIGALAYTLLL